MSIVSIQAFHCSCHPRSPPSSFNFPIRKCTSPPLHHNNVESHALYFLVESQRASSLPHVCSERLLIVLATQAGNTGLVDVGYNFSSSAKGCLYRASLLCPSSAYPKDRSVERGCLTEKGDVSDFSVGPCPSAWMPRIVTSLARPWHHAKICGNNSRPDGVRLFLFDNLAFCRSFPFSRENALQERALNRDPSSAQAIAQHHTSYIWACLPVSSYTRAPYALSESG